MNLSTHTARDSIVELGQVKRVVLPTRAAAGIDQLVAPSARRAEEVEPVLVNLGGDGAELEAATAVPARPHGDAPSGCVTTVAQPAPSVEALAADKARIDAIERHGLHIERDLDGEWYGASYRRYGNPIHHPVRMSLRDAIDAAVGVLARGAK